MGGRRTDRSEVLSPQLEIEAKFLIGAAEAARLRAIRRAGPFRVRPISTSSVLSLYLDTPGGRLRRRRVALRVRRQGRRWELTAKWEGRRRGAVHERPEVTLPLPESPSFPMLLPRPLHRLVRARGSIEVVPYLRTDMRRYLGEVVDRHGRTVAEIAVDNVSVAMPSGPVLDRYRELEVELRDRSRDTLARLVGELRRELGPGASLQPSPESKLARGLRLLAAGRAAPGERPLPRG